MHISVINEALIKRDSQGAKLLEQGLGRSPRLFNKIFPIILLILTLPLMFGVPAARAATIQEIDSQIQAEERRRKELDQKLESYKKTIQQMKVKENNLIVQIDTSKQKTEKTRQEITILEYQVSKLQKTIIALNEKIGQAESQIKEHVIGLRRLMVEMSKYGVSEELQVIFSAQSTHDVLDSIYLMEKLSSHEQFLIEQLHARKQELETSKQAREEESANLKKRMQALERERSTYNSAVKQTNAFLNDIRKQKALAERAAREMEEAQAAVGQTIMSLMRQRKERDAASSKQGGRGGVDHLAGRIGRGRGSMFDWPVRGQISSSFGRRVHPVFKTKSVHSGIDIASPRGTPIKAAAPGEVLYVGWMRGYGQVVIVDHGRDYSTVYAHMSSTRVKEGAIIKAGTVVGTVGDTGTATGYHLHFEVRVGSSAKNPLDYLKR